MDPLRNEYNTLHTETGKAISDAKKDGKEFTAEQQTEQDKKYARMDAIQKIWDAEARDAKYAVQSGEPPKDDKGQSKGKVDPPREPEGKQQYDESEGRTDGEQYSFDEKAYNAALNHYCRTGVRGKELYAWTSATGSGAYLPKQVMPPIAVRRLRNAFRNLLNAYGMPPIETGDMAAFSLPVENDTSNTGAAQAEGATSGTVQDPTDASLALAPTLYTSKQRWFSNTMILGQSFDVKAYVFPELNKRLDKSQESAWTTDVLTNGTVGKTLAAATAITYAELLDWEHSLAAAYREDAGFVVADSLYKLLRGLLDDNHRPILDLDPTNQFVGKIHGKPVIVSDYFEAVAANKKVGAFLSADAIKIVDVLPYRLTIYQNDPDHPDQQGFELFGNGDMDFVSAGVAVLKTAIS